MNERFVLIAGGDRAAWEPARSALAGRGLEMSYSTAAAAVILRDAGQQSPVCLVVDGVQGDALEDLVRQVSLGCPELAILAVRPVAGVVETVVWPGPPEALAAAVVRAAEITELRREVEALAQSLMGRPAASHPAFEALLTQSPAMDRLFRYLQAVARSPKPLLITGESGTGKELLARAAHALSRPGRPFVAVNVAGIDDQSFSDTLFGHVKGAFTGADTARVGLIEQAADGVVFLDEIGDLEQGSQVKLLRLLQENEYFRLGSDKPSRTTARFFAATNRDLKAEAARGTFRFDLYQRLLYHHAAIPPLRERPEDIGFLADRLLADAARQLDRTPPVLSRSQREALARRPWPGNVRELQVWAFDAVARSVDGKIEVPEPSVPVPAEFDPFPDHLPLPTLADIKNLLITKALARSGGNQRKAAALIQVSQSTLSRHGLEGRT